MSSNARPNPIAGSNPESSPGPNPNTSPDTGESRSPSVRSSRWIDYNSHELLEMISELEDERRWARLREGMLWAILVHISQFSSPFSCFPEIPVQNGSECHRDEQRYTMILLISIRRFSSRLRRLRLLPLQPRSSTNKRWSR
jgi:hypothetical protein